MRSAATIIAATAILLAGCKKPSSPTSAAGSIPRYTPESFRSDIAGLIGERQYQDAVTYVQNADVARQVAHDPPGYIAIAQYAIDLPGAPSDAHFNPERDWEMPGTSDAIEDMAWQEAASKFAEAYNAIASDNIDK